MENFLLFDCENKDVTYIWFACTEQIKKNSSMFLLEFVPGFAIRDF